jgi:cytochrome c oxidase subunit 2
VPVLGVGLFVWAPFNNHWLPKDVSAHGHEIDHLFNFILWLTGAVFVATEMLLFWFIWRYDAKRSTTPVQFTHGSHNLEIVWKILPAATLLFIAIYQMNAWADVKMDKPDMPFTASVTARQFEWRIKYPGADGVLDTADDLHVVNDLHVPLDEMVMVRLESEDVLHDFFLPHMRIKQDAVPGMAIPVWFRPKESGTYDLVCAELCGWGHYKMKGRLTVEPRSDFEAWLQKLTEDQNAVK